MASVGAEPAAARPSMSPAMWSASTAPPRSMSFIIDAVMVEPGAVSMASARSCACGRGARPLRVAMALHSASSAAGSSAWPAETMSPMLARIKQVALAAEAMNTHFSHISWLMSVLALASKPAPLMAARMASARAEEGVCSSPKIRAWASFRCSTVPSAASVEAGRQLVEVAHAVEQRQDHGVRADGGGERFHRRVQVVGLAADDDDVVVAGNLFRQQVGRMGQRQVAARALDVQAGLGQLGRASGAQQEGDVLTCGQQAAAEVSTERTGAHDQKFHGDSFNVERNRIAPGGKLCRRPITQP